MGYNNFFVCLFFIVFFLYENTCGYMLATLVSSSSANKINFTSWEIIYIYTTLAVHIYQACKMFGKVCLTPITGSAFMTIHITVLSICTKPPAPSLSSRLKLV